MAIIEEIIRAEADGSVSFGDYVSTEKRKLADFESEGNLYSVKTHSEITRLEKNGKLLLETVPGAAVHSLLVKGESVSFGLEGTEDTRVTIELAPNEIYRVLINGASIGNVKSNVSGKVIFSMELDGSVQPVEVNKA